MNYEERRWTDGLSPLDWVSQICIELPYPVWKKIKESDEWALLEEFVDSLERDRPICSPQDCPFAQQDSR